MTEDSKLLEICKLKIDFRDGDGHMRRVAKEIDLTVRRGETLGIVGESGSGKSVSTLALMGLLPPAPKCEVGGEAWFYEPTGKKTNLLSLSEKEIQHYRGNRISMIFQEPMTSLNPVHRCGQQVVEMLQLHEKVSFDEARKRVLTLFEEVLLPRPAKIFDSYPHELSGGQKQRVMIAMALVCQPELVIADEPTTALDVTVQKTILDLLRQLQQKRNIAIIFITHDLGVIAQIADEVAVVYHGEIVEYGKARQVLHHPTHPYTQGLLACRPPLQGRPHRLPTVADFMNAAINCCNQASPSPDIPKTDRAPIPLLSVKGLDVAYTLKKNIFGKPLKQLKAVDNISFDVYRGETLGLVGESGCGKTTMGRAILQLVDSASGSVSFDGRQLNKMSPKELRKMRTRMQIIFQDPYSSLNPRMTVGQAIIEPLQTFRIGRNNSERRQRVLSLMEQVGLQADWFDRYPHEFSGGQRQRVCIARALIVEPELVICDESVSALDVSVQAQVLNLLNELKEQYHYTYIFISHDLSVVRYLSDRILVMRQGQMVELDTADAVFQHPQKTYTKELIDAIPRIEPQKEPFRRANA